MRLTKLRPFVGIVSAVLGSALLVACGGSGSSTGQSSASGDSVSKITVQSYPGLWINALVWIAIDQEIDKKHGLDIEAVGIATGPLGLAALQAGSIDLSLNSSDNMLLAADKGMDVKSISGSFGNLYTLMASPKLDLPDGYPANVEGLNGYKIGITAPGASTDILARSTVKDSGLDENAAEYVAVGGTAGQVAAINSGVVDAVIAMTPQDTVFRENGEAVALVDYAAGEGPEAVSKLGGCFESYFGVESWLSTHEKEASAFQAALKEASDWGNDPANSDALAKLLNEKAPMNNVDNADEVARLAVDSILKRGLLSTNFEGPECLNNWNDYLVTNGVLKQPVDTTNLVWQAAN